MPRRQLERASVVQAAVKIINAEGVQALTLNRLAKDLGIQPPSLYNHIQGLAGLQRELALLSTQQLGDALARAAVGKSGQQAVLALALAYRTYAKSQPGLYETSLRSSAFTQDSELEAAQEQLSQVVLAVVGSFGLQGADAIHAVRGLRSLVHGFVSLENAGGFGLPVDCDESFRRMLAAFIAGLEKKGPPENQ